MQHGLKVTLSLHGSRVWQRAQKLKPLGFLHARHTTLWRALRDWGLEALSSRASHLSARRWGEPFDTPRFIAAGRLGQH